MANIVEKHQTVEYAFRLTSEQASFLLGLLDHVSAESMGDAGFLSVYDALSAEYEHNGSEGWQVTATTPSWSTTPIIEIEAKS